MLKENTLLRYLNKTASQKEVEEVENWIETSPENRKHFQEMLTVFYESNHLKTFKTYNLDEEWNKFKTSAKTSHKPIENVFSRRKIILFASAACLTLICAFFFLFQKETEILRQASDQQLVFTLPDQTIITLFPHSSASYDENFNELEIRKVVLNGKATFDVASNKAKPFLVEASLVTTEVVGTIFTVDSYKQDSSFVSVEEGQVAVKNNMEIDDVRILNEGNSVSFYNNSFGEISYPEVIVEEPVVKATPKPKKKKAAAPKPVQPKKEIITPAPTKPQPKAKKAEVLLSKYPVNDVLNFLDKQHPENKRFSKSKKAKVNKEDFVMLNLNEPIEKIIERLELKYNLSYDDEKCTNCIDLKKITKK